VLTRPGGDITDEEARGLQLPPTKLRHRKFFRMPLRRFGISVGAGILLGIALIRFDDQLPRLTPARLGHFLIALWISVVVHEAGHAIAAVVEGFKLLVFAVKPFKVYRTKECWRLGWLGKNQLSGFVSAVPRSTVRLRQRTIILVAGGPIASLVLGGAILAFAVLAQRTLPAWLHTQLIMIGACSLFLGFVNAIPRANPQVATDGHRLRMLLRASTESECYCAILLIAAASYGGLRPREWDTSLMERLPGPTDGSPDNRVAQAIRYNWLVDSRRIAEAEVVLQHVLSQDLPEETAAIWSLEAAWFEAKYNGDLASARRWLETKVPASAQSPGYRCALAKARVAVLALEQDWTAAEAAALETYRQCELLNDAGTAIAIGDAVREILNRAPRLESSS